MEAKNEMTITRNIGIEWVLCSLGFEDVVQITSKELNSIPIESNYKDTKRHNQIHQEGLFNSSPIPQQEYHEEAK